MPRLEPVVSAQLAIERSSAGDYARVDRSMFTFVFKVNSIASMTAAIERSSKVKEVKEGCKEERASKQDIPGLAASQSVEH